MEKWLIKVVSTNRDKWDERILATLWAYRTTVKRLHKQTRFQLVYIREVVVPAEFILPSMFISEAAGMTDNIALRDRLGQLLELDETWFLADFHQSVEQRRQNAWHDRHIRKKAFEIGEQVLLYDNKFQKFPGKLQMHWLGSFIVTEIRDSGEVRLTQLYRVLLHRWVNGTCLNPFHNS